MIDFSDIAPYFIWVILAILAAAIIKATVDELRLRKKQLKELEAPCLEPQIFEYNVTVAEKYCEVVSSGIKTPNTQRVFTVAFKAYDGSVFKHCVTEQEYLQIEENSRGTLAVVNGNFYGFCPNNKNE